MNQPNDIQKIMYLCRIKLILLQVMCQPTRAIKKQWYPYQQLKVQMNYVIFVESVVTLEQDVLPVK